ncbi:MULTISPECIES: hypothetical protein [unclassified Ornithinimicrobium]|uniref:hypothetical protein n=1 Tax=unclassified Ornithinimicrobium TaxID=2615080 RepID=UPI003853B644
MSQMTVSARLGRPFGTVAPTALVRAQRRTRVVDAAPSSGHAVFRLFCAMVVALAFTAVLLLNTVRAENSYVMARLQAETTQLHDQKVTLESQLADLESAETLAAAARKLKMVPSPSTATLRLSDGSLTGVASMVDGGRTLTVELPSTGVAEDDPTE